MLSQQTAFFRRCTWGAIFTAGTLIIIRQGLPSRNQVVLAIANEVCSAHGFQCISQKWPMLGIVIAQKSFVQSAPFFTLDHIDLFTVARNFAP